MSILINDSEPLSAEERAACGDLPPPTQAPRKSSDLVTLEVKKEFIFTINGFDEALVLTEEEAKALQLTLNIHFIGQSRE